MRLNQDNFKVSRDRYPVVVFRSDLCNGPLCVPLRELTGEREGKEEGRLQRRERKYFGTTQGNVMSNLRVSLIFRGTAEGTQ